MPITPGNEASVIDRLLKETLKNGEVRFLYTLVRVDGILCRDGCEDKFLQLRKLLSDPSFTRGLDRYQLLAAYPDPLNPLQNLVNCAPKQLYDIFPVRSFLKGSFPRAVRTPFSRSCRVVRELILVGCGLRVLMVHS